MKKAMFWKSLEDKKVQCLLCPQKCRIPDGKTGGCRVRKNIAGVLYSLNYGRIISTSLDPVEKKPLFHFYPGSEILSIATVGCNFHCKFCQNWDISQSDAIFGEDMTPQDIVDIALKKKVKLIAYTYTEPTIFFEFAYDTAKIAHSKGIKNVFVTNGFINRKPLEKIAPYLDAVNIDIKSMGDVFYRKLCGVRGAEPVLDTIRLAHKLGIHIEITNLLIPGWNTSEMQVNDLCSWVVSLDKKIPLHFSRYFPAYKLSVEPTPMKTLDMAYETAKKKGIEHVYFGNVPEGKEDTYCPSCKTLLIKRKFGAKPKQYLNKGECPKCRYKIYGVGFS